MFIIPIIRYTIAKMYENNEYILPYSPIISICTNTNPRCRIKLYGIVYSPNNEITVVVNSKLFYIQVYYKFTFNKMQFMHFKIDLTASLEEIL